METIIRVSTTENAGQTDIYFTKLKWMDTQNYTDY